MWLGLVRAADSHAALSAVEDEAVRERLTGLNELVGALRALHITADIDMCVVRSHEYYTGISFEVDVVAGDEVFVEVGGGGRYDRLTGHFALNRSVHRVPATGFAFGVERLVALLDRMGLLGSDRSVTATVSLSEASADTLIVCPPTAGGYLDAVRAAARSGADGRSVDIYVGAPESGGATLPRAASQMYRTLATPLAAEDFR